MKKQYRPGQKVYRLPPCPAYDIAGMENWLADMAKKGLFLTQDGFFAGVAAFEYRKPQKAKYRLEAAQKSTSLWSDNGGEPDPEQLALGEKYSWEYVAKRKSFFIYRSLDPSARELNTDPEVQALALNAVKKRQGSALFSSIFFLLVYPVLLTRGCLLLTSISTGTWRVALVLLLAALILADEVMAFVHLKKVQKSLTEDGYYAPDTRRKKNAAPYFLRKGIKIVLAIVLVCAFLQAWGLRITDEKKIPLDEYDGTLPFAAMRDFAGADSAEYTSTMSGLRMGFNTVEEKTDWLAPRCIEYNEHAVVKAADGDYLDGGLYVDYFELRSPNLAKQLAGELYRFDKMKKGFASMDTPELSADYAAAYFNNLHFPTVLIRKGNVVVRVYFYQTSESYQMPMEEWAKVICDSLGK